MSEGSWPDNEFESILPDANATQPSAPSTRRPAEYPPFAQASQGEAFAGQHDVFSPGLRVFTYVLSALKAAPLVFLAIALVMLRSWLDESDLFYGPLQAAAIIAFVALAVLGLLLALQVTAAINHNKTMLILIAGLLALLDCAFLIGNLTSDEPASASLVAPVTVGQVLIFVLALRSRNRPRS